MRTVLAGMLIAVSLSSSGCALIGWAAASFAPPEKIKPRIELPKDKTVLVFVEASDSVELSYSPVKAELANNLNEQLKIRGLVGKTVEAFRVQDFVDNRRQRTTVQEACQEFDADVAVQVTINKFVLRESDEAAFFQPRLQVNVAVMDKEGTVLWPEDMAAGYPMKEIELPPSPADSSSQGVRLAQELARRSAASMVLLFAEHERTRKDKGEEEL